MAAHIPAYDAVRLWTCRRNFPRRHMDHLLVQHPVRYHLPPDVVGRWIDDFLMDVHCVPPSSSRSPAVQILRLCVPHRQGPDRSPLRAGIIAMGARASHAQRVVHVDYAAVVAVDVITVQVVFALDLFWINLMTALDFILFQCEIFGRLIEVHTISVFMSQLWTILAWFCRILWCIVRISRDDETVMLLDQVGYDNYMYERKRRRRRPHMIKKLAAMEPRSIHFSRRVSVKPTPVAE